MCQKTQFFELFLVSLLPTTAPFVGQVPNLAEMLAARFLVGHIFSIIHRYIQDNWKPVLLYEKQCMIRVSYLLSMAVFK